MQELSNFRIPSIEIIITIGKINVLSTRKQKRSETLFKTMTNSHNKLLVFSFISNKVFRFVGFPL